LLGLFKEGFNFGGGLVKQPNQGQESRRWSASSGQFGGSFCEIVVGAALAASRAWCASPNSGTSRFMTIYSCIERNLSEARFNTSG
jgi:hypothetical protein